MGVLELMEARLGLHRDQWSLEQWRGAAESLALHIDGPTLKPKGRPRLDHEQRFWSKAANYQALAWKVRGRIDEVREAGKRPIIKDIVRDEIHKSWVRYQTEGPKHPNFKPMRESRVEDMLPTAYTEVRKILKKWQSGD
jgi:hypothetical protein